MGLFVLDFKFPDRCHWGRNSEFAAAEGAEGRGLPPRCSLLVLRVTLVCGASLPQPQSPFPLPALLTS